MSRNGNERTEMPDPEVMPGAGAPQITRFTVDPPGQITLGQCVMVCWQVEGELDLVLLTANDTVLWDGEPASGSYQDCPTMSGNVAYALEATGPGGTSHGQQDISVVGRATATSEPTAAPELPVIHFFLVAPAEIPAGECLGISWCLGGGTTYSRILCNGAVIIDDGGYSGQQMDCLDTAESYTDQLEAYSTTGEAVTEEQSVTVTEAASGKRLAATRRRARAIEEKGEKTTCLTCQWSDSTTLSRPERCARPCAKSGGRI
jgi:hypothetical protein